MRRSVLLLASVALAVVLVSGVALAAPASFDASFGGDGKVITDFSPPEDPRDEGAEDVVVQPDGKIVTVGYAQTGSYTDFALARYNGDGSLDASFGSGGKVSTDMGYSRDDYAYAVALQSDGKIVVAGHTNTGSQTYEDFAVVRYNTDGTLDTSFSEDGKVITDASNSTYDYAYGLAIQSDDKVVVAGYTRSTSYNGEFALIRYNSDGALDTTFDGDGKTTTDFGGYSYGASALGLQTDGKIVAVGSVEAGSNIDFALARYNEDGSPDTSFDSDGKAVSYVTSNDDEASDLALQKDGKIVVAGEANYNGALVRYNTDGSMDRSFNLSGKALNTNADGYGDVALQKDDRIVAQNYYGFGLWRHNADGTLDTSFRGDSYRWGYAESGGLALQSDGKIVQAGRVENASGFLDFAVTRSLGAFQDATKPTGSVTIDGGRPITKDTTITLSLNATDPTPGSGVTNMRIKNAGSSWSNWTRYAESKVWRVNRKAGTKTVYVQYRDGADNVSVSAKDTIIYRP